MSQSLSNTNFSSLRELVVDCNDADVFNHSFRSRGLLNPYTGVDDLSIALQRVAQLLTIKILNLTGSLILSKAFFNTTTSGSVQAEWPLLEILNLQLSTMTPSGGWYYTGDPDPTEPNDERSYDSKDEEEVIDSADSETEDYPAVWEWIKLNGELPNHFWRDRPDPEVFNSLLIEVVLSFTQMPCLRDMTLRLGSCGTSLVTDLEYRIAGSKSLKLRYTNLESDVKIFAWPRWDLVLTQT